MSYVSTVHPDNIDPREVKALRAARAEANAHYNGTCPCYEGRMTSPCVAEVLSYEEAYGWIAEDAAALGLKSF